ncbi:MAG: EamA family transporter [Candidatus Zipacnadales bacterium]
MLEIGGSLLSDRAKGVLLGLMASGAWGTVFLCARYLTDTLHIDPLLLTAARFTLSGIALVAYGLITGQGHRLLAGAEDAPKFLLLGLLGVVGLGVSVFTSIQYT